VNHRYVLTALIVVSMVLGSLALAPRVHAPPPQGCAPGATICWVNQGGFANWEDASNWNLARVPTAADDVDLPATSTYIVILSSAQTVHSIHVGVLSTLQCNSGCTLTILAHTPVSGADGDVEGTLSVFGNVVNKAALVNLSPVSIDIHAGGTFVNVNSLDTTNGDVTNNGAFVEKCNSQLLDAIPSNVNGEGIIVTESPCPTQVSTASGSPVSGIVSFSSDLGGFTSLTSVPLSGVTPAPPSGLAFRDGLFSFTISGLRVGQTISVTITLPSPLPAGDFSYWKFHGGSWQQLPLGKVSLDSTRTVITLTLTDGVSPDDSDSVPGQITDPAGPGVLFDFSISNGGGVTVVAGASGSTTITTMLLGGVSAPVSLSATGFPLGALGSANPFTVNPTSSATPSVLTVSTSPSTKPGTYTITVTGSGSGQTHTTSFTLQIIAAPPIPEYPLSLPLLVILMLLAYGMVRRKASRSPRA
jgi:hypothetical protein